MEMNRKWLNIKMQQQHKKKQKRKARQTRQGLVFNWVSFHRFFCVPIVCSTWNSSSFFRAVSSFLFSWNGIFGVARCMRCAFDSCETHVNAAFTWRTVALIFPWIYLFHWFIVCWLKKCTPIRDVHRIVPLSKGNGIDKKQVLDLRRKHDFIWQYLKC